MDHADLSSRFTSFQGKGFWTSKDADCLTNGGIGYDSSSRIEPKRAHQWFMDGAEAELLPNKKQAVEVPSNNSFSGMPNPNLSPWGNISSLNSVNDQFSDRLMETEAGRTINFDDRNISSISDGSLDMGRKAVDDPFGNDSPFGLSISQTLGDPRSSLNYGGIRKVKVSQVRDDSPTSMALAYSRGDNSLISTGHSGTFISVGHSFNNRDGNTRMGHDAFDKGDDVMPVGQSFCKEDASIISMGQSFSKADSGSISAGSSYNRNNGRISMGLSNIKGDCNTLSIGHSIDKGESNIICFGGFNDNDDVNASGRLMCSYDLLMGQPPVQISDTLIQKDLLVSNTNTLSSTSQVVASTADISSKKKEEQNSSKKMPPNNFPSNVRSLLATGMLDGITVKYVAWSREQELRGVIKGSGYLCGCQACNFSKVINAYEFERHASCKTKHPNNHIYFDNGKTIYGVVQELRSTPQNMLFDVIQTITGSPIDQKSFRLWKESFLAATRELERIYGTDEGKQLS
ncbi:hypothetical protein Dimus_034548 [Dionaea muscipula]